MISILSKIKCWISSQRSAVRANKSSQYSLRILSFQLDSMKVEFQITGTRATFFKSLQAISSDQEIIYNLSPADACKMGIWMGFFYSICQYAYAFRGDSKKKQVTNVMISEDMDGGILFSCSNTVRKRKMSPLQIYEQGEIHLFHSAQAYHIGVLIGRKQKRRYRRVNSSQKLPNNVISIKRAN